MLLGAFIAAALLVLGYFTLFLTEFSFFGEQTEMRVWFPDAKGLRDGDAVLVAGLRWGKVKRLEFDPDQDADHRILAVASLNEPLVMREGYEIEIRDSTLLGGRQIVIDPGPAGGSRLPADAELRGKIAGNPLDALGDLVQENSAKLTSAIDNLEGFTGDLRNGSGLLSRIISDQQMADEFAATITNAREVSEKIASGEGTIGKLINDDKLYRDLTSIGEDLSSFFDEASALVTDARSGNGLLSQLINDGELAADVRSFVSDLRELSGGLRAGEGTIGKLLKDDAVYNDIERITKNLAETTEALNTGDGTLARLLRDDQVFRDLERITSNLAEVSESLNTGDGTLAKLLNDDELYQELRKVIGVALSSLEEFREAAPVTTFTSVLFGAF